MPPAQAADQTMLRRSPPASCDSRLRLTGASCRSRASPSQRATRSTSSHMPPHIDGRVDLLEAAMTVVNRAATWSPAPDDRPCRVWLPEPREPLPHLLANTDARPGDQITDCVHPPARTADGRRRWAVDAGRPGVRPAASSPPPAEVLAASTTVQEWEIAVLNRRKLADAGACATEQAQPVLAPVQPSSALPRPL